MMNWFARAPVRRYLTAQMPFELLEELGAGGMGTVYRARDGVTGEVLAVKVLGQAADPERFALETGVLAKLRHPAIVTYRGHGKLEDGTPYLAMEWVDGESLEDRLRDRNLSVDETLRIGRAIADALFAAHNANVVHRDLKPTNVLLVRETNEVKIVDFGIARVEDATGVTRTGQAVGSAGYMSPEQARGGAIDGRADLFALGCVLYRCLTGRRPFAGTDLLQFATALVLHEAPPVRKLAPQVPEAVELLVMQLLEKEPVLRPESALHVRRAIDRILDADDATALAEVAGPRSIPPVWVDEPATVIEGGGQRRKRSQWKLLALAAAVAAVGLVTRPVVMKPVKELDRSALTDACKHWGEVIAHGQRPEGGFAGETRFSPTGWDTAQQLYALTQARKACNAVGPEVISSGVRALERLRVHGVTPSNAWALLALRGAAADVNTSEAIESTRADLLAARNPDGGFRHNALKAGRASTPYATLMATWALMDDEAGKDALPGAVAWLEREAAQPSSNEPGFSEQLAWVLARAAKRGLANEASLRVLGAETIDHCKMKGSACTRHTHETGRIKLNGEQGQVITFWHPWATLASYELATHSAAGDARKLRTIASWGAGELGASSKPLASIPEYKLSEHLMVVSELLLP